MRCGRPAACGSAGAARSPMATPPPLPGMCTGPRQARSRWPPWTWTVRTTTATTRATATARSEEHTSELQSQSNLVCRLLLEKKKNVTNPVQILGVHLCRISSLPLADHLAPVELALRLPSCGHVRLYVSERWSCKIHAGYGTG